MTLHATLDYYSLPTEKTSNCKAGGSNLSQAQGAESVKGPVYKKRKLEVDQHRLHQYQSPKSHLIPMRWEKHSLTNRVALSQLLRKTKSPADDISVSGLHRSSSYRHHLEKCKPKAPLEKQKIRSGNRCEVAMVDQQDKSFPAHPWDQLSKLRSTSFGAVGAVASGKGHKHWYLAFEDLMEDLIEDAEDILLTLPYTEIREALSYTKEILGQVKEGRLVLRGTDKDSGASNARTSANAVTTNYHRVSDVIWADPEFDIARRKTIMNEPKQFLYSIHDTMREIIEAYYYPRMVLNDTQQRKDLIRSLANFTRSLKSSERLQKDGASPK